MFVKYATFSGKISSVIRTDASFAELLPEHCLMDDTDIDLDLHYIDLTDPDNPTPAERPTSPVTRTDASAPLSTSLTLHDVPEGSILWINGERYDAEGEVELEFPLPGTYRLRVECFPFLDWVDEVAAPVVSGVEP